VGVGVRVGMGWWGGGVVGWWGGGGSGSGDGVVGWWGGGVGCGGLGWCQCFFVGLF
jgi:hypothetical protein